MGACSTKFLNLEPPEGNAPLKPPLWLRGAESDKQGLFVFTSTAPSAVPLAADGYHYEIRYLTDARHQSSNARRRASLGALKAMPYSATMPTAADCDVLDFSPVPSGWEFMHLEVFRKLRISQSSATSAKFILNQERLVEWGGSLLEHSFILGEVISSSWGNVQNKSIGSSSKIPGIAIFTNLRFLWFQTHSLTDASPCKLKETLSATSLDFQSLDSSTQQSSQNIAIGWRSVQQISPEALSGRRARELTITCQHDFSRFAFSFSVPASFWKAFLSALTSHIKWFRATSVFRHIMTKNSRLVNMEANSTDLIGQQACIFYSEKKLACWSDMMTLDSSQSFVPYTLVLTSRRLVGLSHKNKGRNNFSIPLYMLGPVNMVGVEDRFIILTVTDAVKTIKIIFKPRSDSVFNPCLHRACIIENARIDANTKFDLGPVFNDKYLVDGEVPTLQLAPLGAKKRRTALELFHETRGNGRNGKDSSRTSLAVHVNTGFELSETNNLNHLDSMIPGNLFPFVAGTPRRCASPFAANTCIICERFPIQVVLGSCEHLACCEECGNILTACPICQRLIDERFLITDLLGENPVQ